MLYYETYNNNKEEWIVFVHGISGDISTWDGQIEDFKEHYNLLLLDLPWHGKSKLDKKLTPEVLNDAIKEVLDKERIEKAHFVGLSLGALVVSQFALQYPNYIHKLVFAASVIQLKGFYKAILRIANSIRYILPYKFIINCAISLIVPKGKSSIEASVFKNGFKKMGRERLIEWVAYLAIILNGKKVIKRLKGINKKTMFISGEYDSLFLDGVKNSVKILGNCKMSIMKKCSHVCNSDNKSIFNKRILKFLSFKKEMASAS